MIRGFTLVELIVVLVVLSVVAGAVAPSLAPPAAPEPGAATSRALLDVLSTARQDAVQKSLVVSAVVDPSSGRYWILTARGSEAPATRSGEVPMEGDVVLRTPGPRAVFVFEPTGPAHGDSIVVLTGAHRAVVAVDRWTGVPYVR